jgi:predicted alpha/beta superfamily hydrolase
LPLYLNEQDPILNQPNLANTEMAVNAQRIDFSSQINGRAYRLFISVPSGPPPSTGHPVLYLIDGNLHFGIAVDTARIQARWPDVRNPVIVGIGYPTDSVAEALTVRNKDLTMPTSAGWMAQGWRGQMPGSVDQFGGMDDYLRVIDEEIKPHVAAAVAIDTSDQTLMGHSLGGLTTLHALFRRTASFQQYVAISPSIWMTAGEVLTYESAFAGRVRSGQVRARVLVSVGSLESTRRQVAPGMPISQAVMDEMTEDTRMVPNAVELGTRLAALQCDSFRASTVVHADDDHNTVPPAAIARGIRFAMRRP